MKQSRLFALLLCALLAVIVFAACGSTPDDALTADTAEATAAAELTQDTIRSNEPVGEADDEADSAAQESKETGDPADEATTAAAATAGKATGDTKEEPDMEHTKVKFTMENGGTFTMELYPEYAPATVENFLKLVESGYYSGTKFHRVYPGFMAQGGEGADVDSIKGEFASNGFAQNTLSHTRGVVSMARTTAPNSASSQFFICYDDSASFLDGDYAAFGKVIDGMETVDAFCDIARVSNGFDRVATSPVEDIVIAKAEIVV